MDSSPDEGQTCLAELRRGNMPWGFVWVRLVKLAINAL